mmetsp:Transcript_30405/g.88911  ORF Transcript_30405/g.88911 Transcript_30405/m.88911 type:complete len:225 (+) Transcript_30405:4125-4799(+)
MQPHGTRAKAVFRVTWQRGSRCSRSAARRSSSRCCSFRTLATFGETRRSARCSLSSLVPSSKESRPSKTSGWRSSHSRNPLAWLSTPSFQWQQPFKSCSTRRHASIGTGSRSLRQSGSKSTSTSSRPWCRICGACRLIQQVPSSSAWNASTRRSSRRSSSSRLRWKSTWTWRTRVMVRPQTLGASRSSGSRKGRRTFFPHHNLNCTAASLCASAHARVARRICT